MNLGKEYTGILVLLLQLFCDFETISKFRKGNYRIL